MNTATMLGLAAAVMAMATAACSAETTEEEKTGQSEDHFDAACVQNIHAPAGSAAWHAALQACLSGLGAGGGGAGGGGGQSCSISTNCSNGSCTCGSGPNAGAACNGAIVSGANACSVLCRYCR